MALKKMYFHKFIYIYVLYFEATQVPLFNIAMV